MSFYKHFITTGILISLPYFSNANDTPPPPTPPKTFTEEQITTQHQITIDNHLINYNATAGNFLLKDEKGDPKGSIFYISYMKDDVPDQTQRPITFCFNGGPGS